MRNKALTVLSAALLMFAAVTFAQAPAGLPSPPASTSQNAPPPQTGEQPPITFKVEVNYVEIDAVVTDQQGRFVRNLTKDDFQIGGQGKPQWVSVSPLRALPIGKFDPPLFKTAAIEPDVRS